MTEASYTAGVDNGTYKNFVTDRAGYGISQWTFHTRKAALLKFAQDRKVSISNLQMQLDYLWHEMSRDFSSMLNLLRNAASIRQASDIVLTRFMMPGTMNEAKTQELRAGYAQTAFNKFASSTGSSTPQTAFSAYRVRVTVDGLNTRVKPTVRSSSDGKRNTGDTHTILEEASGPVDDAGTIGRWGKVSVIRNKVQVDRWVALMHTEKI
jgi:hypothetical protein